MEDYIVFMGAGASVPFGVPTMTEMVNKFEEDLEKKCSANVDLYKQRDLYRKIKGELKYYQGYDIEALITVLQDITDSKVDIARKLNLPSVHYFSSWYFGFDEMVRVQRGQAERDRTVADELLRGVKRFIAESCRIKGQPFEVYDDFFHQVMAKHGRDFRQSLKGKSRNVPCIIFTTNYDQVLEAYCIDRDLDWECGQAQNQLLDIASRERNRLYDPNTPLFQIHKLHGSVNWYEDARGRMRWITEAVEAGQTTSLGEKIIRELLIYPAVGKYTFREPFYTMFHYLKERLMTCKACYVVGYSFRDDDILGLFHDNMRLNNLLNLTIIDPQAQSIKADKFPEFTDRINPLSMEFSVEAARNIT